MLFVPISHRAKGFGDLVRALDCLLSLLGKQVDFVLFEDIEIKDGIELKRIYLDGQPDKLIVIPLQDQVVV